MTKIHDATTIGMLYLAMRGSVLVVDSDRDVSSLVADVLTCEGFAVVELTRLRAGAIQQEVARVEPDVVLLDGWDATGYGQSWIDAAWLHARTRPIPVIMFTCHSADRREAELGESERSQAAAFAAIVAKPFDVQELIDIVTRAVEEPTKVLSLRQCSGTSPAARRAFATGRELGTRMSRRRFLHAHAFSAFAGLTFALSWAAWLPGALGSAGWLGGESTPRSPGTAHSARGETASGSGRRRPEPLVRRCTAQVKVSRRQHGRPQEDLLRGTSEPLSGHQGARLARRVDAG